MTWSRRKFVRTAWAGAAAAAALPLPLFPGIPRLRDFRTLRRNVGIYRARGGTTGWLVNRDGIAVVDSQFPDSARAFLDGLEGRAGRTLDVLVNTHHHSDHTSGNPTFRPETRKIVAHARARELHAATGGDDAREGLADETFTDAATLEVGDERLHLRHHGPAHTGGDTVIRFERANVIHMGDLVFNRAYPFIDRPGGASVRGWISLLEEVMVEAERDTLFVFGHGNPRFGVTGSRGDVRVQQDFLAAVLDEARRAVADGRSRDELGEMEPLPGFGDFVPIGARLTLGFAVQVAYDELSAEGSADGP
jgi:cyclase